MDEPRADDTLVVNTSTRIVHRASCYRVTLFQLAPPLPLELWPADELDRLRGCGTCEPPGWTGLASRRPPAYTSAVARTDQPTTPTASTRGGRGDRNDEPGNREKGQQDGTAAR